jgi:hypothetical protein
VFCFEPKCNDQKDASNELPHAGLNRYILVLGSLPLIKVRLYGISQQSGLHCLFAKYVSIIVIKKFRRGPLSPFTSP